jgi:two-component system, NtrC family, sensor kinase
MNLFNNSRSTLKNLLLVNAAVCILYILTANIGLLLALPPGVATPIWPPSGIALTSVILFDFHVLPGIFLGSAITNFFIIKTHWLLAVCIAVAIALGSTLQAGIAVYCLKKMGLKRDLLANYKMVFSFIGVSLGACLISSGIGTFTLFLSHFIGGQSVFNNWLTWWLGDAAGMIVFTPFLLEWLKPISMRQPLSKSLEAFLILAITLFIALLTFGGFLQKDYPLEYILIPCLLWSVFRLGSQITTLALIAALVLAVWGTANQNGPFVQSSLNESLILLELFVCIVSITILILIAVLKELRQAQFLLEESNRDLEQKVKERTATLYEKTQQLQEKTLQLRDLTFLLHQKNLMLEKALADFDLTQKRALVREKLAYLGDLTAGIAHQMRNPLNYVINLAELSEKSLAKCIDTLTEPKTEGIHQLQEYKDTLLNIKNNLNKIFQHGKNANTIIETMIKQAQGTSDTYEFIDLNSLVEEFVNLSYHSMCAKDNTFEAKLVKEYDPTLENVPIIQQDLSRCLVNILNNAYEAIIAKKKEINGLYSPEISIKTENFGKFFAIKIRDNGNGIASENLNKIFTPFFTTKARGSAGFGLSIANDLIVQNLGGEIKVDSVQGEYAEFTLILPKIPPIDQLKNQSAS